MIPEPRDLIIETWVTVAATMTSNGVWVVGSVMRVRRCSSFGVVGDMAATDWFASVPSDICLLWATQKCMPTGQLAVWHVRFYVSLELVVYKHAFKFHAIAYKDRAFKNERLFVVFLKTFTVLRT